MHLSWASLIHGLRADSAKCPSCGSERVRRSRESYDGSLAELLDLRPCRCLECQRRFAVRVRYLPPAGEAPPPRVPIVSFGPAPGAPAPEEASPAARGGGGPSAALARGLSELEPGGLRAQAPAGSTPRRARACPSCGSANVWRAGRQPEGLWSKVIALSRYRCLACDFRFERARPFQLVANLAFLALLATMVVVSVRTLVGDGPSWIKKSTRGAPKAPKRR